MTLVNKRILVTGVASGIGQEVARYLIAEGAIVTGLDRNVPAEAHGLAKFYPIDLANPTSITSVVNDLHGKFDGLANVAGASSAAPIELQFRVNFLGTRALVEALDQKFETAASVVNVAAGAGLFWRDRFDMLSELLATEGFDDGLQWLANHPQEPKYSYARSKEALIFWTLHTAVKWIERGRRMNAVSPGPVETPMLDEFRAIIGTDVIAADAKRTGRAATAADIAPVVGFLLDDRSAWINGANVAADGGFSASALTSKEPWPY